LLEFLPFSDLSLLPGLTYLEPADDGPLPALLLRTEDIAPAERERLRLGEADAAANDAGESRIAFILNCLEMLSLNSLSASSSSSSSTE
jgi:hypothetical protein